MKKPTSAVKRLAVGIETIATLTPDMLGMVVGGFVPIPVQLKTCLFNSCNTKPK